MKYETIKNNRDFVKAYKRGKKAVSNLLVVYKIKNNSDEKRIGITVSKKVGKAVVRNRVKRLIRQAIYENYNKLTDGYDYVFVARIKANGAKHKDVLSNVIYAVNKIQKRSR